ncbi:MAG: MBL fold metallo-hydrolase [Candidatus Omnitrophica bacterium]|nr:MBL fold metallo-hydrolase [Candidatus Omnitrophota bacterium]MBD3269493.1 MBL fold metallo-hydrolase [Candidatus Omnitrophota bacterium]
MSRIKEDVYWVGYLDWGLRNFHGYSTPHGSTYNAYLIDDELPVLVDTVKYYGFQDLLEGIRRITDPSRIKYIISNHTEMDHSGSIERLLQFCPEAEIVCSSKGKEGLLKHFKKNWKFKVVGAGDSLNLGKRKLTFLPVPMVHWPDSMLTYSSYDKILFSNDAFGQHYACSRRFAKEAGIDIIFREAAKYYANIVMPYGSQVEKALDSLSSLDVDMICPSHGLIWKEKQNINKIINLYRKWAGHSADKKAVIIYDTMWNSTKKISDKLFRLLHNDHGIDTAVIDLSTTHISEAVTAVMESRIVLIGSPVLNNGVFPSVGKFLIYLKGLKPKNKLGMAFGSYGWNIFAFKELENFMKDCGIEILGEGKYFNYIPSDEDLSSLAHPVRDLAESL